MLEYLERKKIRYWVITGITGQNEAKLGKTGVNFGNNVYNHAKLC